MPSWKDRGLISHRHNCLGAFVMTHTGKLFVATPSQKWTKIKVGSVTLAVYLAKLR